MATEKRLIDAMEFAKRCDKLIENPLCLHPGMPWQRGVDMAAAEALQMPTVDAVEVVHGHWVSLTDCSNAGVYCSVCNKKVWKEDYAWCNRKNKLRSNYCPNCGAKMDGDGNG